MEQKPAIMNKGNLISNTEFSKRRLINTLEHAKELKEDPRKKERMQANECKVCFYGSRIGGASMTNRECMSCGKDELYASTATDVLCMDCAKKHKLCKHCGADIELRVRRKEWPV